MKIFGLSAKFNYDFDAGGSQGHAIYSKVFLSKSKAENHIDLWITHMKTIQHPFGKIINIKIEVVDYDLID